MDNYTQRTNIIDRHEMEERRKICMNTLLNLPWIDREKNPKIYYWIKEQYLEIREWFTSYTGFSVIMNRKLVKLEKVPVEAKTWMGFDGFREPVDYALFTYGLWYLENKSEGEQFLLTDMVKEIKEFMNEQGLDIDWKNYFHRLSMARALKKLRNLNVLSGIDGQESEWAADARTYNVLYECTPCASYILRNFKKELSAYQSMEELNDMSEVGETVEKNALKKHQLYRRYLLEPFVPNFVWKDDQLYFHGQKNNLIAQIQKMFGWEGNKYKEGILFFYPELTGELQLFPTLSSISDLTLLFCSIIRKLYDREELDTEDIGGGTVRITRSKIEHILMKLQGEFGDCWSKEHREMKSSELASAVCGHLKEWGFGIWQDDMFFLLYALGGRWNVQYGET